MSVDALEKRYKPIFLNRCQEHCRNQAGLVACGIPGCLAQFRVRQRHVLAAKEVYDHLNKEHLYSEL